MTINIKRAEFQPFLCCSIVDKPSPVGERSDAIEFQPPSGREVDLPQAKTKGACDNFLFLAITATE